MLNYLKIEECIEERLKTYSNRINIEFERVNSVYVNRLNNLQQAYPQENKTHFSKLMFNAYEGTIRFFERKIYNRE